MALGNPDRPDNPQTVRLGRLHDRGHLRGPSRKVYGNNRAREVAGQPSDLVGIKAHRVSPDVREDRASARMHDHIRSRGERHRRDDHFIARSKTDGDKRQVKSRSARINGDRVRRVHITGKLLLKLCRPWPGPNPGRPQRRDHLVDLGLLDVRPAEHQIVFAHRLVDGPGGGVDAHTVSIMAITSGGTRAAQCPPVPGTRDSPPPVSREASSTERAAGRRGPSRVSGSKPRHRRDRTTTLCGRV